MPPALDRALRSIAAGLCGSAAHTILMTLKDWFGWLPAFRPYDGLQALLASLTGSDVPALVPWLLTYFNGAVVLGLIYGRLHRFLPGGNGVAMTKAMLRLEPGQQLTMLRAPARAREGDPRVERSTRPTLDVPLLFFDRFVDDVRHRCSSCRG